MEKQRLPACNAPCQRGLWATLKKRSAKHPSPSKHLPLLRCLSFPRKGVALTLEGAAPPPRQREARGWALGVPQQHPLVLATAGEAPASRWGARGPPNRNPLVRRGRPAAPTLRRGAGNKGGCVRPSRSLARRPDTHSCNGQGFPGCRRWDARGGYAGYCGGLRLGWFFFPPFFFSFISSLWVSF